MRHDRLLFQNLAARITFLYIAIGSLWILWSDRLLVWFHAYPPSVSQFQTLKGWFFVLVSGSLLYGLLRVAVHRLQESERYYRALFAAHPKPMWVYNRETLAVLAVNSAAIAHYGYSEAEFLAMTVADLHLPKDIPRLSDRISQGTLTGIWNHRKRDGQTVRVEITSQSLHWENRSAVALVAQDVTERLQIQEQLEDYAFQDWLTGLPNQRQLIDRLHHLLERQSQRRSFALLSLDVDRFRTLKYGFGHHLAEQLLVEVARRLRGCAETDHMVARVGTNEFSLLIPNVTDRQAIAEMVDRIHASLETPFVLDGMNVSCGTSIGAVIDHPDGHDPEDYLRAADTAMHYAKRRGSGVTVFYEPGMKTVVAERLKLEADLRRAIEGGQLHLHYQPIVSLITGRVVGWEALARWNHPTRGFVSPAEFIPVAEETGLIVPLGKWVLSEVNRQIMRWSFQIGDRVPLRVSVNLSEVQLRHPHSLTEIEAIARSLPPLSLKLEITETSLMENVAEAIPILEAFKATGIEILIDDFGTGYSSLSYLQRLPVDTVKIDRAFITDIESNHRNHEIVRTIVALAHSLGFNIIAEGIETSAQAQILRAMGCQFGQGYFFSRPLNADAAIGFLQSRV